MKNHKILFLERDERFQETLIYTKKCLEKNWIIHSINDKQFSNIKYSEKQRKKIIKNFEESYKTNFGKLFSNYILYYDYLKTQGLEPIRYKTLKSIENDMAAKIVCLEQIKNREKIDVIFYETLDSIESLISLVIFKSKKQILLEARYCGIGPAALYPATGIQRKNPLLEKANKNKIIPSKKNLAKAKLLFKIKNKSGYEQLHEKMYSFSCFSILKKLFAFLNQKWAQQPSYFSYRLNSFFQFIFEKKYLNHKTEKKINILFFLSHLPEASTFSESPENSDPINIILRLARNRPSNVFIFVKEHPRSLYKRPNGFYRRCAKIPGVFLLHPKINNKKLFKKANALLVVTGSAGLQAGLYNLPVGVLGRPAWCNAPWVSKLNSPEEIFSISKEKQFLKKDIVTFYARILENSFPLNLKNMDINKSRGMAIANLIETTFSKLKNTKPIS